MKMAFDKKTFVSHLLIIPVWKAQRDCRLAAAQSRTKQRFRDNSFQMTFSITLRSPGALAEAALHWQVEESSRPAQSTAASFPTSSSQVVNISANSAPQ